MKLFDEFKKFAFKGNVIDLAVGVIIGGAFSSIVSSVVNDIIMPIVGVLIGGKDFSALSITIGSAQIKYGMLIQSTVNFLIIAAFLFAVVKSLNALSKKKEEAQEQEKKKPEDIALLEAILAELKK